MTPQHLLKLILENRDLLLSSNYHAYEHLQLLNKECAHLLNEEVTINIEVNNSLAEIQFNSDYNKAIENSLQVVAKYDSSVHRNALLRHYWLLGRCYANTGEFEKAEESLLSAYNRVSGDSCDAVTLKVDLLHTLTMNEQIAVRGPEKSIQYLTDAMALLTDKNDIRKATCLMALGNVYINIDNVEKALEIYHAAAGTFEHHFALSNMGNVYCNIGTCYLKMEDFDRALEFLDKSLALRIKVGSPEALSISYYNMGLVFRGKKDLDRAEDLFLKCKEILLKTNSKPFLQDTENELEEIARLRNKKLLTV